MRCPKHLTGEAAAAWRWLIPTLRKRGTIEPADLATLEICCVNFARWRHAEVELSKAGVPLIKGADGQARPSPYVAISRAAQRDLLASLQSLRLDARSRDLLTADDAEDPADADDFEANPAERTIVARHPEEMAHATTWTVLCPYCARTYGAFTLAKDQTSRPCAGCGKEVRLEQEDGKPVLVMGEETEDA